MASTCLARRKLDVWCLFARSNYRSKTTKEGVQLILIKSASEERSGMFWINLVTEDLSAPSFQVEVSSGPIGWG